MVIGVCTVEINLHDVHSLKQKRSILKSLMNRLHREFNVSCSEIALHDAWGSAAIGIAVITTAAPHAQRVLDTSVRWIEHNRPDLLVVDHSVEIIF